MAARKLEWLYSLGRKAGNKHPVHRRWAKSTHAWLGGVLCARRAPSPPVDLADARRAVGGGGAWSKGPLFARGGTIQQAAFGFASQPLGRYARALPGAPLPDRPVACSSGDTIWLLGLTQWRSPYGADGLGIGYIHGTLHLAAGYALCSPRARAR